MLASLWTDSSTMDVSSIAAAASSYSQARVASQASLKVAAIANRQIGREGEAALALLQAAAEVANQASSASATGGGAGRSASGGVDVYA